MSQKTPYFHAFQNVSPPECRAFGKRDRAIWHLFAGATIGLGLWYLHWRWTASLNPDALIFSVLVAACETVAFVGTALFFFDIWDESDTPKSLFPATRQDVGLQGEGAISVDVYVTTFDEDEAILRPSLLAAISMTVSANVNLEVYLLDDGDRLEMRALAQEVGVKYLRRQENRGFKAGNLANALFQTNGDFVIICDADTQLFPTFLDHTLGYFRDLKVSWVQTPHWFYDLPQGCSWRDVLTHGSGRVARLAAPVVEVVTGRKRLGDDHFLSDPSLFFDVIQRRRNRNSASFCCGAGSIHRRDAIFESALLEQGALLKKAMKKTADFAEKSLLRHMDIQPFRYHVSEDIYTSIQQHNNGWKSVYHPVVEARMLSPWSFSAWAIQKLKYAGGTFDIMLHANPIFRQGMPWRVKLHYLSTFWSYLAILWLPVLVFAPAYSLLTGNAPMASFSVEFFAHVLPVLLANEIAMNAACKGHNVATGRILSVGTLFIQWRAFLQVIGGQKPHFPTTPKTPRLSTSNRRAIPNISILTVLWVALIYGAFQYFGPSGTYSTAFFVVNAFWILWVSVALIRTLKCALFHPQLPEMN